MKKTFAELFELSKTILIKLGFSETKASFLAQHLVMCNALGHDSHGVIRLAGYAKMIETGRVDPRAEPSIETDNNISFVNGHNALGQFVSQAAAELAVKQAKQSGMATVGIYNTGHTGRIGAFVDFIAQQNVLGIYVCNGHSGIKILAPHGGIDPVTGANPFAFAAPRYQDQPIVFDMSTSNIAYGKVMVAKNKEQMVADESIIDETGKVTQDPKQFHALLPVGGEAGFKGFGLTLLIEILAGVLSRARCESKDERYQDSNGGFMIALDIEYYLSMKQYYSQINAIIKNIKSSRHRTGFSDILLPGERSAAIKRERLRNGIPIDEKTWQEIIYLKTNS